MYNQVERGSQAFDDAIHESIWVSIKRGEYRESIRQLELMMIHSNVAAAQIPSLEGAALNSAR